VQAQEVLLAAEERRKGSPVGRGLKLGSISGIQIVLDWSLFIIFFLVAFSLGAGAFPSWHPDWPRWLSWLVAIAAAALFLVSVLAHELSHALLGRAHGIGVHRITLFVFGGMAQMEREPHAWGAELWMAIAGPVTSLVIGLACIFLGSILVGGVTVHPEDPLAAVARLGPVPTILMWLGPINVILAVFNLVPVSSVMLSSFSTVAPETRVAAFIDDCLVGSDQRTYPVVQDDRLIGLVSLEEVRKVPTTQRMTRTVTDIMIPARQLAMVAPGTPAAEAFSRLSEAAHGQLPVVVDGRVRGLLRREDVLKWMTLHGPDQGVAGRA
jgi:Zn-dependent protease